MCTNTRGSVRSRVKETGSSADLAGGATSERTCIGDVLWGKFVFIPTKRRLTMCITPKNSSPLISVALALICGFALSGCAGGGGSSMPSPEIVMPPPMTPDPRQGMLDKINEIQETERANNSSDDVAVGILRASDSTPLGLTSRSLGVGSTTQSPFRGVRASFLAEYDADGLPQFSSRVLLPDDTTAVWVATTDQGASPERLEGVPAEDWKGVELTGESDTYIHYVDLFSDIENSADIDYLAMGYWLSERKERSSTYPNYLLMIGAGGSDPFVPENVVGLTGTATYEGHATGLHTKKENATADPVIDYFTAKASLTAIFGDANALGTVSGTITDGMTAGGDPVPDLTLGSAEIKSGLGNNFSGDASGNGLTGTWGGKFYSNGAGATDHPGSTAGTFGAKTADLLQGLIGAFAAYKN